MAEALVGHTLHLWATIGDTHSTKSMREDLLQTWMMCKDNAELFSFSTGTLIEEAMKKHAASFAEDGIWQLLPSDHRHISQILFASMKPVRNRRTAKHLFNCE